MIEQMTLRDVGVIAQATLPIGPGFTAITGETGAGKTMVVTGLGLLLGARADSGVVRAGADQAAVEGVWIVADAGGVVDRVAEAGGEVEPIGDGRAELYLGRTVTAEGRSRASVGGRAAPAGVLADLAEQLVVVHGQSDQLRLRSSSAQRDALDRFGAAQISPALDAYRSAFTALRALSADIAELTGHAAERAAEAERLRAALVEIEQVDPQPGEDVELAQRAERLANVEELRNAAAIAHDALSGSGDVPDVGVLLAEARRALERASHSDAALAAHAADLDDISYRVADLTTELSAYLADLDESGPHELAAVEERRAAVSALVRAHGSVEAARELARSGAFRLAELDDDGERIARLRVEETEAAAQLDVLADNLTRARRAAAEKLAEAVTEELHDLALPDAHVVVAVEPAAPTASGRDDITLLLSPHPGAEPRPVAKSASGGELSRVMLAIEVVIAGTGGVPTFVFDEIDAGIGGASAIEVGRRLARLAETAQVIVVTHLAQVAAFASNHLSVVKSGDGSVTASSVRVLEGAEREAEMARLLSGLADSTTALDHARELLSLGRSGLIG
ncbi:DNA repair protein RecN [Microbacterium sp. VKM Ac-2870]|uniref:DNA repair protein RecN n=1 Tax=Microbacterium sp. VKM Ac-2870 TaxID=2783825 RepID=UPI00188B1532|nr:DNA repair protein RecN [Microbacterium sp. VKM Ac-2870]MBF4561279.1 DNA repair protein RecN [Microbacterium sp. VKM Ac-2870]